MTAGEPLYQIKEARGTTGSRREPRTTGPKLNHLMGQELVLAVGSVGTSSDIPPLHKQSSVRNSFIKQNQGGSMIRSWTRPINSAGGSHFELPYAGNLPTLGLIKPKGRPSAIAVNAEDESREIDPKIRRKFGHVKKYGEVGYELDPNNPYSREGNTEKLLIAQEKQREFKENTKADLEGLRVFEKGIQTR